MMCFKIGAEDAKYMSEEFQPVFSQQDLTNIANYQAYIKLNINNATSRGFSMSTIYDPHKGDKQAAEAYKQLSRLRFARDKEFVEREIFRRVGMATGADAAKAPSPASAPPPMGGANPFPGMPSMPATPAGMNAMPASPFAAGSPAPMPMPPKPPTPTAPPAF
jgi:hypothetical protein